jgi:hypothetical protein
VISPYRTYATAGPAIAAQRFSATCATQVGYRNSDSIGYDSSRPLANEAGFITGQTLFVDGESSIGRLLPYVSGTPAHPVVTA